LYSLPYPSTAMTTRTCSCKTPLRDAILRMASHLNLVLGDWFPWLINLRHFIVYRKPTWDREKPAWDWEHWRLWPTRFIGFTAFGTDTSYVTVILTIFGIISITRSLYYTKYLALNTVQTGKRVAEQQNRYSPIRAKQWMGSYTIHFFFPHPPNYQKWPLWWWTVYYTSVASKYLELISLVLVMILMNR